MADNVIESFLVALGFSVDQSSLQANKKSIADHEKAVRDAEQRIVAARLAAAKSQGDIDKLKRESDLKDAREALSNAQKRENSEKELSKKRQDRAKDFASTMSQMVVAATAAAAAIGYAISKITSSFDNLYFQAQRSGTSVQSLKALSYGFSQTGGSAQQAVAAVDSFTTSLRNNPGLRQFVKDLGVNENLQGVDKLLATVDALKKEPYEVGVQHASMLGISETDFNLLARQGEQLKKYRAEYDETTKRLGLNSDEAAKASMTFQRALTRVQTTVSVLGDKLLVQLAPALEKIAIGFTDWLAANPEKVEHILKSISNGIVWLTEKITALVKWFGGTDGQAFVERWDTFSSRIGSIVSGFEKVWGVFKDIDSWLEDSRLWKFLKMFTGTDSMDRLGIGAAIKGYFTGAGGAGGGGGPLGVGSIGGFNPLEGGGGGGADKRNLWQRLAPKALGGKDAPSPTGGVPTGSSAGNLTALYEAEAKRAGIDPRILHGIRTGESLHSDKYDVKSDSKEDSYGPFQLNRRGGLGAEFEKQTGLDLHDPKTIPAQVRWASEHIKKKLAANPNYNPGSEWYGYKGLRDADPKWKDSGYTPTQQAGNVPPVNGVGGVEQKQGGAKHRPDPITDVLQRQIAAAATAAGVNAEIHSGGQDENSPNRTGSHRHDHGGSADLKLYTLGPDGSKRFLSMNNESDRVKMETFLREGVKAGANGIGAGIGYMGENSMHIGGGSPLAWGAGGRTANAPDWVRRAHEQGLAERGAAARQPRQAAPASMSPGGFDVNRMDPAGVTKAAPMGAGPTSTSNSNDNRAVHQTINSNTTINEARNAKEAGRSMEGSFGRMHSMALSNAQSAVA